VTRWLAFWLVLVAPLAQAAELLEPEKAFRFSARVAGAGSIEVAFRIAEGYYMYRERFRFEAPGVRLGPPEFPAGKRKSDPFFGETEIYRGEVRIRIPVQAVPSGVVQLEVTSQGCADVGVCYVPMQSRARLKLAAAGTR